MMVPRSNLLWLVAVVVLPLTALAAFVPRATPFVLAAILCVILVAVVDALLARGRLSGVHVRLPDILRLTKDKAASLPVRLQKDAEHLHKLRLGFSLPPEIGAKYDEVETSLLEPGGVSQIEWECTPSQRGRYLVDNGYLGAASPARLWEVRDQVATPAELRVYPNLARDKKSMASLLLNRGVLGMHVQRQVGKGREFEKLREYSHGDSYDDISWKATARRGKPVTKVYQIERTQEVYVVIDASRLSARILKGEPLLEHYLTAALLFGLGAERQGDLFGLIAFSDKVDRFVRAKNGKAHYGACRDAIYTVQPRLVAPDFGELCNVIRTRLRRRALLVFLTELDDPVLAEQFERSIALISRQHLVLANMVRPDGLSPLFAGPDVTSLPDVYDRLGSHTRWQKLNEVKNRLKQRNVQFSFLQADNIALQLMTLYRAVKQRQAL
jgi:uncharacterized protein (DUF58 family)